MDEQREASLEQQLLGHISNWRDDEAKAMLNEELARTFDHSIFYYGTLLHHAVLANSTVIARRLIELGADVNRFGGHSATPLTLALRNGNADCVLILLEANARFDIVDDSGISALQVALDTRHYNSEFFDILIQKLKTEASTNEELAELLIRAGCNMCHAATLRDVDLMRCMLKRGVDVNSRGFKRKTALHVAVRLADVNMADWLLSKGIDVDAIDMDGSSALTKAAESGNKLMVQLLLERGAYPDVKEEIHDYTPLYAAYGHLRTTDLESRADEYFQCAELLLQHGASLRNAENLLQMFHFALKYSCDKAAKQLIARLAMLEMHGETVDKSVVESVHDDNRTKMTELWEYYEPCQQVLAIEVFDKLSLLDLLNESDRKLRMLVRTESFFKEVEKFSSQHKLSELYPFYYNSMMRRIEKVYRILKLEEEAISVICKLFKANDNRFYHCAREIVKYLNERDCQHLVEVRQTRCFPARFS